MSTKKKSSSSPNIQRSSGGQIQAFCVAFTKFKLKFQFFLVFLYVVMCSENQCYVIQDSLYSVWLVGSIEEVVSDPRPIQETIKTLPDNIYYPQKYIYLQYQSHITALL